MARTLEVYDSCIEITWRYLWKPTLFVTSDWFALTFLAYNLNQGNMFWSVLLFVLSAKLTQLVTKKLKPELQCAIHDALQPIRHWAIFWHLSRFKKMPTGIYSGYYERWVPYDDVAHNKFHKIKTNFHVLTGEKPSYKTPEEQ